MKRFVKLKVSEYTYSFSCFNVICDQCSLDVTCPTKQEADKIQKKHYTDTGHIADILVC